MLIMFYVTGLVVVVQHMPRFVIMVWPAILQMENPYVRIVDSSQRQLDLLRGVLDQHNYVVRELYCQLHCAEPFPTVRLKTVYMDFCNDGYVVNSFEVIKTQPSFSVTVKHMSQPLQFSKTKCFSVAAISADVSTVELPVLQCVISSSCHQQFANECISPALSSYCDVVQPLATCLPAVSIETETDISSYAIRCSEIQVTVSLDPLNQYIMPISQYHNTNLDLQPTAKRMSYHSTCFGVICSYMLFTIICTVLYICTLPRSINQAKVFDPGIVCPRLKDRSEERRVGKECRSRWSPYH